MEPLPPPPRNPRHYAYYAKRFIAPLSFFQGHRRAADRAVLRRQVLPGDGDVRKRDLHGGGREQGRRGSTKRDAKAKTHLHSHSISLVPAEPKNTLNSLREVMIESGCCRRYEERERVEIQIGLFVSRLPPLPTLSPKILT